MELNALFTDGAVFQRRMSVPVFGKTTPVSKMEITFQGKKFYGMAGADGSFLIRMTPFEAGGPYEMEVLNLTSGDKAVVRNILIGEVWLASGQSNMQFGIASSPEQMKEFRETVSDVENIRMFSVPQKASTAPENQVGSVPYALEVQDENGTHEGLAEKTPGWQDVHPENIPLMSAVGLWFARKLHDELNVPVGIIHSSWGGTIVEAWTSTEMLRTNPALAVKVSNYLESLARPERWDYIRKENPLFTFGSSSEQFLINKYCTPNPPDAGSPKGWADCGFDDSGWMDFSLPNSWIAMKICGNGVVWVRKNIDLPSDWAGKDIEVHTAGIDKHDTTFFNGEKIGSTGSGFQTDCYNTPRCYQVPGRLVKAGCNTVAIRAYSFIYDGAFCGNRDDYYVKRKDTCEKIIFGGPCKANPEVDFHFAGFPGGTSQMGPLHSNSYGILFDSMIRPLIPYAIRGAIWYQGESNARPYVTDDMYCRMMCDMIRDWRFRWGQGDFPFIQVCLAGYTEETDYSGDCTWGPIRNGQRKAMRQTPNSGLASALDVGDIVNIHPLDKKTVGNRLALWALENTYRVPDIEGTSPEVVSAAREGTGKIRLAFEHCRGGLVARNGVLKGFYAAEDDGVYFPAEAVIDGCDVIVTCARLPLISCVRYAWSTNPMQVVTLYNKVGLPANPFEITVG